jgi:hypothetical protein
VIVHDPRSAQNCTTERWRQPKGQLAIVVLCGRLELAEQTANSELYTRFFTSSVCRHAIPVRLDKNDPLATTGWAKTVT